MIISHLCRVHKFIFPYFLYPLFRKNRYICAALKTILYWMVGAFLRRCAYFKDHLEQQLFYFGGSYLSKSRFFYISVISLTIIIPPFIFLDSEMFIFRLSNFWSFKPLFGKFNVLLFILLGIMSELNVFPFKTRSNPIFFC